MMAVSIAFGGRVAGREDSGGAVPDAPGDRHNVLGNKPQYAVARDGRFLLNTAD